MDTADTITLIGALRDPPVVRWPRGSDRALQDCLEEVAVTLWLVLFALTQERDGVALRQVLEETQGELLTVIFDRAVPAIDRTTLEQFLPIAPRKLAPGDLVGLESTQELLARTEIGHPHMVASLGQPPTAKTGGKDT